MPQWTITIDGLSRELLVEALRLLRRDLSHAHDAYHGPGSHRMPLTERAVRANELHTMLNDLPWSQPK